MIHLVDQANRGFYVSHFAAMAAAAASPGHQRRSVDMGDDRFRYALELAHDGSVVGCLQTCGLSDAAELDNAPMALAPLGVSEGLWVCGLSREPQIAPVDPWEGTPSVWVGVLEAAWAEGQSRVMTVVDQWRYALAIKHGMPWRKVGTIGDGLVLASIEIDRGVVERLGAQFGVPTPTAYHVDDEDLDAWGSLKRVEQEFTVMQQIAGTLPTRPRRTETGESAADAVSLFPPRLGGRLF